MKLMAFMSVYNEGKNIPEIVEQVYPHVDHMVIVDGRYKDFNIFSREGGVISTDVFGGILRGFAEAMGLRHTDEKLRYKMDRQKQLAMHRCVEKKLDNYNLTIVNPLNRPWDSEIAKLSTMFHYGEEDTWILVIDGDERIRHANWEGLRYYLENIVDSYDIVCGVPLYDYTTGLRWHCARLIRWMKGAVMSHNHHTMAIPISGNYYYYDRINDGSRRHDLPEELKLLATNHLNRKELEPERWEQRVEYYKKLAEIEQLTPYSMGQNRYHRAMNRFSWEPIEKESQAMVKKALEEKNNQWSS